MTEIIEMARQVGFYGHSENFFDCTREQIEAFAKLVAAKEQARCCSIIYGMCGSDNVAERTVKAIRARGKA